MKIINVFKTHFDIGFTELASEVTKRYGGSMLEDVLAACEKTQQLAEGKRFVWTMAAWPLLKSLENCSAQNLKRAENVIANGQLVTHALPFTTHTELLSPAELPRLFDFAEKFCLKYSLPFPKSAKMTDVPGHTVALVKALSDKGVKFLHLGCNPASTFPDVPTMFWWDDLRGNRVLTFYNKTYGSAAVPPKGWKYPVWLSMQQSNDNIGPQDASVIDGIFAEIKSTHPAAEVSVGTMDDFYEEIIKCDLSDLPVVSGDLGDTWIHGAGTYPKEMSLYRHARKKVADLNLPREQTKDFYENAILFCEHTFGLDVKTHLTWQRSYEKTAFLNERSLPRYKLMEKSWDEQRKRALFCHEFAQALQAPRQEPVQTCVENEYWKISGDSTGLKFFNKKLKISVRPEYRYQVIGTQQMTDFMRQYLTRFYDWAIADFGRQSYGEVEGEVFLPRLSAAAVYSDRAECNYVPGDFRSCSLYGDCQTHTVSARVFGEKLSVRVKLNKKQATPYIESGDFYFKTDINQGGCYINKIDCVIDCEKDIVKDANTKLFAINEFAQLGGLRIESPDVPLVSFGESAIYVFNGGTFERPKENNLVFNLFNNMWGTNFPQWTEGDFEFEFILRACEEPGPVTVE